MKLKELRRLIREEIGRVITDPRMNNPNPTMGIFSIKDRTGNKYTLVASQRGKRVNYYKVLGWEGTSGTPFDISRLRERFPKIKIDAEEIISVLESDLKGYTVHWYELT